MLYIEYAILDIQNLFLDPHGLTAAAAGIFGIATQLRKNAGGEEM